MRPTLFADSNVLIEALLIPSSAAYVIAEMVTRNIFDLVMCQLCVDDTEDAIIGKLEKKPDELDQILRSWQKLKIDTRLIVLSDPDAATVLTTRNKYLSTMRHKADIPVLASALSVA